jgi:hypothetical protein
MLNKMITFISLHEVSRQRIRVSVILSVTDCKIVVSQD